MQRRGLRLEVAVLAVGVLACAPAGEAQTVLYVDADAAPGGSGLAWSTAYDDLQDALAEAQTNSAVEEILVAEGIYRPDGHGGDAGASFALIDGVALYGGYVGFGHADPNARDTASYETVLSGDLNGDDGPDFANNGENSYNVVVALGVDMSAVLDGFIVSGGNANGACCMHDRGGGLYIEEGSPTVADCMFIQNSGTQGGGMCVNAGGPTLTACTFTDNQAAAGGAGLYNYNATSEITDCVFTGNTTPTGGGGGASNYNSPVTLYRCVFSDNWALAGGGLANNTNSGATLVDCTFTANTAEGTGGGMYNNASSGVTLTQCGFIGNASYGGSGAMYCSSSSPTLTDCEFRDNWADGTGGALQVSGRGNLEFVDCRFVGNRSNLSAAGAISVFGSASMALTGCTLESNRGERGGAIYWQASGESTWVRCVFRGNAATQDNGGALYAGSDTNLTLVDCVFSENSADQDGGGIALFQTTHMGLENCTFHGNRAEDGFGGGIYNYYAESPELNGCILWANGGTAQSAQIYGGTPVVNYCCVQGGGSGLGGVGNTVADPLFVDVDGADDIPGNADDNLRLGFGSPSIDTGDPAFVADPGEQDLDGHARVLCGRVDMGAYESGFGDTSCDQDVDAADYAFWTPCMTGPGGEPYAGGCVPFDSDLDGDIDLRDFAAFQAAFTGSLP
ncbi:MAG: right-handed parallel beta-helix repeat-containing protein [bacterium]|nr:right-handed parallel beta-helix repeat-containing protein [bacterium]